MATGHDHQSVARDLARRGLENVELAAFAGRGREPIQYQHPRTARLGVDLPEVVPCEPSEVLRVLDAKRRRAASGRQQVLGGRLGKIVKEGGLVLVIGIELVPEAMAFARGHVTGRQRSLARSGRAADPHDGTSRIRIHEAEEAFARHQRCRARSRGLGQRDRAAIVLARSDWRAGGGHGSCVRALRTW